MEPIVNPAVAEILVLMVGTWIEPSKFVVLLPTLRLVVEKLVVVADVPVAMAKVKFVKVDDADERKPFRKARVVEVACSPVPSLVKSQEKVSAAGQLVRQSPAKQTVPEAKVVEVALVVVELVAVNDWRVVEALRNVWAPLQAFPVVVPKPRERMFELKRIGKVAEIGAW